MHSFIILWNKHIVSSKIGNMEKNKLQFPNSIYQNILLPYSIFLSWFNVIVV